MKCVVVAVLGGGGAGGGTWQHVWACWINGEALLPVSAVDHARHRCYTLTPPLRDVNTIDVALLGGASDVDAAVAGSPPAVDWIAVTVGTLEPALDKRQRLLTDRGQRHLVAGYAGKNRTASTHSAYVSWLASHTGSGAGRCCCRQARTVRSHRRTWRPPRSRSRRHRHRRQRHRQARSRRQR